MLSADCTEFTASKGQSAYQTAKMVSSVQRLIDENLRLKQQIDQKYRGINDLHEIAEYLEIS